jgi:hypothetical protein
MTLQEKSKRMLEFFEKRVREKDGSSFWCLKDYDQSLKCGGKTSFKIEKEKYQEIIHKAHEEFFPDDYKYEFIVKALETFSDLINEDCPEDAIYEITADEYTSDLTNWLSSHNGRIDYLTQALEECSDVKDGFQILQIAQEKEIKEVAFIILNELLEN